MMPAGSIDIRVLESNGGGSDSGESRSSHLTPRHNQVNRSPYGNISQPSYPGSQDNRGNSRSVAAARRDEVLHQISSPKPGRSRRHGDQGRGNYSTVHVPSQVRQRRIGLVRRHLEPSLDCADWEQNARTNDFCKGTADGPGDRSFP